MTADEKKQWILVHYFRAGNAIVEIIAAKKTACAEYDDRVRGLKEFINGIRISDAADQLELFDPEMVLTPAIHKLLRAPLHGLD